MGRCDDKNCRLKWINLKDPVKFYHGFGHFLFIQLSNVRAQKRQKNVALASLASNAAGSSIAVSNDYDMACLYLSDPEFQVRLIFPKRARDFFLLDFRPSPNPLCVR